MVWLIALLILVPFIVLLINGTKKFNKDLDDYCKAEQELNSALADYIKFKMDKGDW